MTSPRILFDDQADVLFTKLPAARDAEVEGVHTARVATRRMRETLPLFARTYPDDVDRIGRLLRRVGRRLGRVRELDVMEADLARRAIRLPTAAPAISAARRAVDDRRTRARRRLVNALDRLAGAGGATLHLPHVASIWRMLGRDAPGWDTVLRQRIDQRAANLRDAIHHATAVYFPNRLHQVRIAAKKLRYSVELSHQTGLWAPGKMLGDLKRVQEVLGDLHDAHVLLKSADDLVGDEAADPASVGLLKATLRGEIAERHAEYLAKREQLLSACQVCREFGARRVRGLLARPAVVVSAVAVPAGLLVIGASGR